MKSLSRRLTGSPVLIFRLLALTLLMACSVSSYAKPEFLELFKNYYKPADSSALGQAGCNVCHDGGPPKRNAYGKALGQLIKASPDGKLTEDMLKQVESQDSDGDGWSNGDEIKQGFLPADASSHPAGTPPPKKAASAGSSSSGAADGGGLIPSHAFHPAFVHFPIALYLFGVFLEIFGLRKKIAALGTAALWNFSGALASMAIVAPTGIAAWLLGKHALEGNMLIHMILAVSALLLMVLTLTTRKKVGPENKGYLVLIVVTAIVIGVAGHFGGLMVYG